MNPLENFSPILRSVLKSIGEAISEHGGSAWLVGGALRDAFLKHPCNDADVEVFGLEADMLRQLLRERFRLVEVGVSFGVFKLKDYEVDISLPRRESKTGNGHKGFQVTGDPQMSVAEACRRRDFTLNALYWNLTEQRMEDPLNGLNDLRDRVLRHCSEQFSEDPLRVLRAMQFAARFGCTLAPETLELCRHIEPEGLARERIYGEWEKLLLKGIRPSMGLKVLKDTGWVHYFPELEALIGCPQDPEWHPEGDVWVHTGHCLDVFAKERTGDAWEDLTVGLAVLCHDLGKPLTTHFENGRYRSPKHEIEGEVPTRSFLDRLTQEHRLVEGILPLVRHHMAPAQFYKDQAGNSAIRKLAHKVERLDRLVRVVSCDLQGSPPKVRDAACCRWILEQAKALELEDKAPQPILLGRDLIALGEKPGAHFSGILAAAFEAQLEGVFEDHEGALVFIRQYLQKGRSNSK